MSHSPRRSRRMAAALGALALALTGFGATAASAANAADTGNIDTSRSGSIRIHKHESGSQSKDGTADGQTATDGTGVAEVVFTAYKITNLNLTQSGTWDSLNGFVVPDNACGTDYRTPSLSLPNGTQLEFDSGTPSPATGGDGETAISNLPVAAYLVCETSAPATVRQKAAPFLVTIPFPNTTTNSANGDGSWLYDVNVYPKNTVILAPTKQIEVAGGKLGIQTGDQVTFPVTATVPSLAAGNSFTHFIISDPFDQNLTDGHVVSVQIDGQAADTSWYQVTDGAVSSVGFTQEGLTALAGRASSKVTVTFAAKVNTVPANGVIENTGHFYTDVQKVPTPPTNPPTVPGNVPNTDTPTNKVVSSWGDLQVLKTDADNNKPLAGATFQVFEAQDPYAADCSNAVSTGSAISVNGTTDFVSDASGVVSVPGLFVDKQVGAPGQTDVAPAHTSRCYVLVETKAPTGYLTPANAARGITVRAGLTNTGNAYDATVTNTKPAIPGLPMTGAQGRILLLSLGAALVLVAVGSVLVRRYREARAQA